MVSEAESERMARRVRITGKVQGVWYRAWTVQEATRRGLSGWVRNRIDGSVEAVFAGAPAAVTAMIDACRRGPQAARVEAVVEASESDPGAGPFEQQPTV